MERETVPARAQKLEYKHHNVPKKYFSVQEYTPFFLFRCYKVICIDMISLLFAPRNSRPGIYWKRVVSQIPLSRDPRIFMSWSLEIS